MLIIIDVLVLKINSFCAGFNKYLKKYIITNMKDITTVINEKQNTNSLSNNKSVNKETIREALIKFRLEQSKAENIKAFYIFTNTQLEALLENMPTTPEELMKCDGFGPVKVKKYGKQLLEILVLNRL